MTTKRETPFAALENLRDQLPVGEISVPKPTPEIKGPARAVVRLEKKQRRGKEVTVVEKLGLQTNELESWCKQLKQTLGCGGTVEGDAIVLQGDFRQRLPDVLTKLGVRKITISGG
ncbi:MAG: translation initiation factor [Kofleriaceae bacterium]